MSMQTKFSLPLPTPQELVGTYRRFGSFGRTYKVVGVGPTLENGDIVMKLYLPGPSEIEEEIESKYSHIIFDPEE